MISVIPTAVYELLLRDTDELSSGAVVHRLQGPGGGEGPTGEAMALVLHRSHGPLLSPVHTVGQRPPVSGQQEAGAVHLLSLCSGPEAVHQGDKLVAEEVAELIHSECVSVKSLNV